MGDLGFSLVEVEIFIHFGCFVTWLFLTVILGQPLLSILKDKEVKKESASRPRKTGPIRCVGKSVTNQRALCDNPKVRRPRKVRWGIVI
jgi:hypothetical protein